VLEQGLAYWREQLAAAVTEPLPLGRRRTSRPTYAGAQSSLTIHRDRAEAIGALARRAGATLHMMLLAVFALLLSRVTRRDDILVGMPVGSRNRTDIEDVVGFFVNVLPVRIMVGEAVSFAELIEQVRRATLGALAHQHVPLERILDELQASRRDGLLPYSVTFGVQNAPRAKPNLADLRLAPVTIRQESVRFDLSIWVSEVRGDLVMTWTYAADVFDRRTIVRLQTQYEALLDRIVANPAADLVSVALDHADDRDSRGTDAPARQRRLEQLRHARPAPIRLIRS
jgi:non-ribosomal peptide synthetase component F